MRIACVQAAERALEVKDEPEALRYFHRGCELHPVFGCYEAGILVSHGVHASEVHPAHYYFDRACDAGTAIDCKDDGGAPYLPDRIFK